MPAFDSPRLIPSSTCCSRSVNVGVHRLDESGSRAAQACPIRLRAPVSSRSPVLRAKRPWRCSRERLPILRGRLLCVLAHREHHNCCVGVSGDQASRRFNTANTWHPNIHENQIWSFERIPGQNLFATTGRGDTLNAWKVEANARRTASRAMGASSQTRTVVTLPPELNDVLGDSSAGNEQSFSPSEAIFHPIFTASREGGASGDCGARRG